MNENSFAFEVTITDVPKGICRKIIEEAFRLYTEKYEDEMCDLGDDVYQSWNNEMFEVYTSLIAPLLDETVELEGLV